MYSMTGFGRAVKKTKSGAWSVEIATVNNRFLEYSVRVPRHLNALEMPIRQLIGEQLQRGKVSVSVNLDEGDGAENRYPINVQAAEAYYMQLEQLRKKLKISGEITIGHLVALPAVIQPDKEEATEDAVWKELKPVVQKALSDLSAMRKKEGEALGKDMKKRLAEARKLINKVEKDSPKVVLAMREKLLARLNELVADPLKKELRLEEEVAYIADRTDVSEECIRFRSHLEQYAETLDRSEPIGKRLNFILQEMNREVNTIGSKCSDIAIASTVIALKEEVEKLREQVQNVE